jgi:hypothetical protein
MELDTSFFHEGEKTNYVTSESEVISDLTVIHISTDNRLLCLA